MRIDYNRLAIIYSLLLKTLRTEQVIILYKTKKDLPLVNKFTIVLHKQTKVIQDQIKQWEYFTEHYEREAYHMNADMINSSPKNLLLKDILFNPDYRSSTNDILLELSRLHILYPRLIGI